MAKFIGPVSILLISLNANFLFAQSPYQLKTNREIALVGTGLAFELFGLYLNKKMPPLKPEQIAKLFAEDVNPFDRPTIKNWSTGASKMSDYLLNASYVWPVSLVLSGKIRNDALKVLLLYGQTGLFTASPTLITKSFIRRVRPYVYNESIPPEQKTRKFARRSFYSGHTVTAFSAAVFTAKVFSDYYPKSDYKAVVWGVSLLHASAVGYLRHVAGKHFPTDIITGAIVGGFTGYIVPEIHKREAKSRTEPQPDIAFSFSFQL